MDEQPNVFISWSKPRSLAMAKALFDWLPMLIQRARPWMSPQIPAGANWRGEVSDRLKADHFGILCVTPENQSQPWLLFEAGALSKSVKEVAHVCPLLIPGMEPNDVKDPLAMFQAKRANRQEVLELLTTLNRGLTGSPLSESRLSTLYDKLWPELESALAKIPQEDAAPAPKRNTDDKVDEILGLVRGIHRNAQPEVGNWTKFLRDTRGLSPEALTALANAIRENTPVQQRWQHKGRTIRFIPKPGFEPKAQNENDKPPSDPEDPK